LGFDSARHNGVSLLIPDIAQNAAAAGVIGRFLDQYYARHPVNATFTGVHAHDAVLPDWSAEGLAADGRERAELHTSLTGDDSLDAELARANLDVRAAEHESGFMIARNPALWTGEAIFGPASLMLRSFAPREQRLEPLTARLAGVPQFLTTMRARMNQRVPAPWLERARRECRAACVLFSRGFDEWLPLETLEPRDHERVRRAANQAVSAFSQCDSWLATVAPAAPEACSAGESLFNVLLQRGHFCAESADELLRQALEELRPAQAKLAALAKAAAGSMSAAQEALSNDHPTVEDYYAAFDRVWEACRALALEHDLVTWPNWPIRYVPIPHWAQAAAPQLYWLFYRSPSVRDPYTVHDYLVTQVDPDMSPDDQMRRLRATNNSVIKLNHVVHHGALGHHVQNWHATHRSRSKIGQVAAIDCASRIGMFLGGSMAEGWACYATELMDELGFLSPLEKVAEQQTRVRMLARAIVDIQLHTRGLSFDDAVRFYVDEAGMPTVAAHAEVTKNSMFPCTALMYWLGTRSILDLRAALQQKQGSAFRLRAFHDELLSYGSIPVPLITRLMTESNS
jgi:hypothetical protein